MPVVQNHDVLTSLVRSFYLHNLTYFARDLASSPQILKMLSDQPVNLLEAISSFNITSGLPVRPSQSASETMHAQAAKLGKGTAAILCRVW